MSLSFKISKGKTLDQYGREFSVSDIPKNKDYKRKYHDRYKESHGVKPYVELENKK